MTRTRIYLSAPYSGDVVNNLARARRWLAYLRKTYPDAEFVTPWIALGERLPHLGYEEAVRLCYGWIEDCQALWLVGGRLSRGMLLEADYARKIGLQVEDMTEDGEEPPVGS
jgi:hypothetical protein